MSERLEEIDFSLNVMSEMLVDEWEIVPRHYVISAIDKLLDRRLEVQDELHSKEG